jgi:branched-chain amino acid transport system permease protein
MSGFAQALIDGIAIGSLYALLALGVALVFGLLGLVNFAHGELIMVGGYTIYVLGDAPFAVLCAVVLVVVVVTALLMERLAFRPVRTADPTTMLVTAFALSYFLQSLVQFVYGARPKAVDVAPFADSSVQLIGLRLAKLDLINIGVAIVLFAGLAAFLRRSSLGTQMRAAAENFRMARLLGVRANAVIAAAFAVSGLFAAVAGVLLVAQSGTLSPQMGVAPVLIAFVATVVGGMGTLFGSAVGGLLLGVLSVLLQTYLPEGLQPFRDAFVFTAVIAILIARPNGIFGSKALTARV